MAVTKYSYTISTDTANAKVDLASLKDEYETSAIVIALDRIETSGDDLDIYTKDALSGGDETILGDTVVANHQGEATIEPDVEVDDDGRQIVKAATTYKGWRYLAHVIEMETAKIGGCFSNDFQSIARGDFTMKFYDDQDVEITSGLQADLDSDCVKTVITFQPTYDFDLIGGNVHQHTTPTENVRMWVVAGAVDLGPAYVKEFVGGLNFKFLGVNEQIETDGRAGARLNYSTPGVPVPTNKMQYIVTHPAGHHHEIMIVMEYFRQ